MAAPRPLPFSALPGAAGKTAREISGPFMEWPRQTRGVRTRSQLGAAEPGTGIRDTEPGIRNPEPAPAGGVRKRGPEAADESACTPGSVSQAARAAGGGGHPSRAAVADSLVRSTRGLGRAALEHPRTVPGGTDLDLAPSGVYRAGRVTSVAGGLLHHRFTLTCRRSGRRSAFCGTVPRVTPGGRYPPPCSVEPGRSSAGPEGTRRDRPAGSSAVLVIVAAPRGAPARRPAAGRSGRRPGRRWRWPRGWW